MGKVKFAGVVAGCVAVVVLAKLLIGSAAPASKQMMGGDPLVVTAVVGVTDFSDRIESIGTASANESVVLTATVAERVRAINFEDGARVKAGTVLLEMENDEEKADLAEAQTDLAEQRREYERARALRQQNGVSEQEMDTRRFALERAQARLVAAESRLRDRSVIAPFSGVLGLRQVSPGSLVSPGTAITTLDDTSLIKLDFTVPETYLSALKPGQEIAARSVAWPDSVFRGTVAQIDSRVDPGTRAVKIQARIPNEDGRLRQGMLLTVELLSNPRRSVAIPEAALVAYGSDQFVYVLNADQTVERRPVTLAKREAGVVEIADGLAEGETIVIDGVMRLRPGIKVQPVSAAKPEQK